MGYFDLRPSKAWGRSKRLQSCSRRYFATCELSTTEDPQPRLRIMVFKSPVLWLMDEASEAGASRCSLDAIADKIG